jgi:hypothetical protein
MPKCMLSYNMLNCIETMLVLCALMVLGAGLPVSRHMIETAMGPCSHKLQIAPSCDRALETHS